MDIYSSCKALIIGVGHYADPQYDLSYARSDAEALAELLRNEFAFDQVSTLYDNDATRQNIIRFFEQDLQRTDEDDGLLIFFAGHGITVTSAIGDDRGFLVPHDGNPKQPYANLSLTTIRDDYLPMIPAKHVFLIVDACYGGLALRDVAAVEQPRILDETVLTELTRRDRKVRQVLTAGAKDQKVLDGGLFGRSVFTGRLIEALREANPYITADHVGVHVRERVARDGADRRHRQTPQFGYLYGDNGTFLFRKSCRTATDASVLPSQETYAVSENEMGSVVGEVRAWLQAHRGHSEADWSEFLLQLLETGRATPNGLPVLRCLRTEAVEWHLSIGRLASLIRLQHVRVLSALNSLVGAKTVQVRRASRATSRSGEVVLHDDDNVSAHLTAMGVVERPARKRHRVASPETAAPSQHEGSASRFTHEKKKAASGTTTTIQRIHPPGKKPWGFFGTEFCELCGSKFGLKQFIQCPACGRWIASAQLKLVLIVAGYPVPHACWNRNSGTCQSCASAVAQG
jgi:hypothetical protein